jgi:hypothetical protein
MLQGWQVMLAFIEAQLTDTNANIKHRIKDFGTVHFSSIFI